MIKIWNFLMECLGYFPVNPQSIILTVTFKVISQVFCINPLLLRDTFCVK